MRARERERRSLPTTIFGCSLSLSIARHGLRSGADFAYLISLELTQSGLSKVSTYTTSRTSK